MLSFYLYINMIEVNDLTKYFGNLCAVDHVSLHVENGIFGLLGPNGAGKSTIVRILSTLLKPTGGNATICGYDVAREPKKVREVISYVPQEMALDIKLTGRENALLYAKLYGIADRSRKVDEVLELMELTARSDDLVRTYSGGMRRRLELAQALVHEPEVLFLDEPTLGLDVAARTKIWRHILSLQEQGIVIFMTTHYMEEADEYCDTVAIIDHGRIVALDTPERLKSEMKGEKTSLNDVFIDRVTTPEEESVFDGYKFRTMLRRRR
ncbi:MAG: multidrug ABC transporter ATP-binding protein [Candidatus Syntrophoarchaeum caldarius]|uniref:Multidrug ABC transporter ATP-binding protein n=1 Tax=Candidatus Syntropharchaeum caldarium TaxID=1838285 RepID=A0A1F2PBQ3_9EURY|nr:MAG: multidrug ABC transporter ATP-binding protein [Candidatus Syntrophoarchaeum caldarius]